MDVTVCIPSSLIGLFFLFPIYPHFIESVFLSYAVSSLCVTKKDDRLDGGKKGGKDRKVSGWVDRRMDGRKKGCPEEGKMGVWMVEKDGGMGENGLVAVRKEGRC